MNRNEFDVCIVGAGIAGCALGSALGKQGKRVAIIERDLSEPDTIIGELLQPGGVQKLLELGYAEDLFDELDSPIVEGYALFKDGEHFNIAYPSLAGVPLHGRSFKYGKFVMKLRNELNPITNVALIEGAATSFHKDSQDRVIGMRYLPSGSRDEAVISAPLTIICDGGNSIFRKQMNGSERVIKSYFLGLLLKDCPLPYPDHGHVFIAGRSPILSYPISQHFTRMLIDFPSDSPPKKGAGLDQYFDDHVLPNIPQQMHASVRLALKENPFRAMPNSEVTSKPSMVEGAILLGDALNMRHPLTGAGMTAALSDVKFISELLAEIDLNNSADLAETTRVFYQDRHKQIGTLNILANALYAVLAHPELSRACFDYLKQGGSNAAGPIELLSAISRDKQLLISHFMAVARTGASNKLKPIPTPARLREAKKMMHDAIGIIEPQLKNEQFGSAINGLVKLGRFALS